MSKEKFNYDSQVKGTDRRVKELLELLSDQDKVDRVVRGKVSDLEADKVKLTSVANEYVTTLDGEKIDEVYDAQLELFDRVDQAIEKAKVYIATEDFNLKILEKFNEAKESGKVIERALNSVEKKVKEFSSASLMSRSVFGTLDDKLSTLEVDLKALAKSYQYLVDNDEVRKVAHEASLEGLDTHREKIFQLRLEMGELVEKESVETKECLSTLSVGMTNLQQPGLQVGPWGAQGSQLWSQVPSLHQGDQMNATNVDTTAGVTQPVWGPAQFRPVPSLAPPSLPLSLPCVTVPLPNVSVPPPTCSSFQVQGTVPSLPKIQMQKLKAPVFDGDVCTYAGWKKQWREMVHPNCSGDIEELYRMQDAQKI